MFRRTSHHQGDLSSSSSRSRSWRLVHFLDHPSIQSASKMPFYQFCFPLEWKLEDCGGRSITPIPPICHISKLEPKSKCNLSTLNSKARQHSTEEKIQSQHTRLWLSDPSGADNDNEDNDNEDNDNKDKDNEDNDNEDNDNEDKYI